MRAARTTCDAQNARRAVGLAAVAAIALGGCGGLKSGTSAPSVDRGIRGVDFRNFAYPATLCAREFGKQGIGDSVRVHHGEWKGERAYYEVVQDEHNPAYTDLDGDGREEAVVTIDCGLIGANYSLLETWIFSIRGSAALPVAGLDQSQLEEAYTQLYPDGVIWSAEFRKVAKDRRTLVFEAAADGPHCCPEHRVEFEYRLVNGILVPVAKPAREAFGH